MDKSKIENAINHITSLQERLCCNISNACKHLNIGCISLIHFWIGTAGCMVNMQQFMKATSILVADSHSMIGYAIQFLFMNMVIDHFNT